MKNGAQIKIRVPFFIRVNIFSDLFNHFLN